MLSESGHSEGLLTVPGTVRDKNYPRKGLKEFVMHSKEGCVSDCPMFGVV